MSADDHDPKSIREIQIEALAQRVFTELNLREWDVEMAVIYSFHAASTFYEEVDRRASR